MTNAIWNMGMVDAVAVRMLGAVSDRLQPVATGSGGDPIRGATR